MSDSDGSRIIERLEQKLADRKKQRLFRRQPTVTARQGTMITVDRRDLVNFCSNDYLCLSGHPEVVAAFKAGAERYGVGSGASPLLGGRLLVHQELERRLAAITGREAVALFSSGYLANLAVIISLVGRDDVIFLDRLSHASLIDAARLSAAKLIRYQHADPESLASAVGRFGNKRKLVLTDGVFSMDGDIAPLNTLSSVCVANGATLVVDDAHGFGVLGRRGGGILDALHITVAEVPILVATFGKALGVAGAFVAADRTIIEALIQFARSYIYSTALSPALASAVLTSLGIVERELDRREKLQHLIAYFRQGAKIRGLDLRGSETAIQPLIIGTADRALQISAQLANAGFFIPAIRPPTVPEGSARLRITLNTAHTEKQIDELLRALDKFVLSDTPAAPPV